MSLFVYLKNNLSIVDVIGEYVQLKQAGSYFKGPCPFHSETAASFTISPDKQIFYCFGCHAAGDLIGFIAKIENIGQLEAAHYLIEKYNISIPENIARESKTHASQDARQLHSKLCHAIAKWTHAQLYAHKYALNYLTERKITEKSIKNFTLGYFPSGINSINKFIKELSQQGFLVKNLSDISFLSERDNFFYTPFEERIIFPIKDTLGNFCGFGGRIFKQEDTRPKYYNSKDFDFFSKGKLLFGLDLAKTHTQEQKYIYLVEGYIDCLMMHQNGYINTVATLGTACTIDHLKIISRHAQILYVMYDGDKAGQNAMMRLAPLCWEANLELKVLTLPPSHDPDSFLRENNKLEPLFSKSQDIFTFFVSTMTSDFSSKTLAEKMTIAQKIISLINTINNRIKRDFLLTQASNAMGIPFESLKNTREQGFKVSIPQQHKEPAQKSLTQIDLLEEKIFSVILNSMGKSTPLYIDPNLLNYFSAKFQELFNVLAATPYDQKTSPNFMNNFLDKLNEQQKELVARVCMAHLTDVQPEVFEQLVFLFCKHNWKKIVSTIKNDLAVAQQNNDEKKYKELLEKLSALQKGFFKQGAL